MDVVFGTGVVLRAKNRNRFFLTGVGKLVSVEALRLLPGSVIFHAEKEQ